MSWIDDMMDWGDVPQSEGAATDGGGADLDAQAAINAASAAAAAAGSWDAETAATLVGALSGTGGLPAMAAQLTQKINDLLHDWGLQVRPYDEMERQIAGNRSMWPTEDHVTAWRQWVMQNYPGTALTGDVWEQPFYGFWTTWSASQNAVAELTGGRPLQLDATGTVALIDGKTVKVADLVAAAKALRDAPQEGSSDGVGGGKAMMWALVALAVAVFVVFFTPKKRRTK